MANRFYESSGSLAPLREKTIAIIGYGSQGHAHALNLRESGLNVVVGLHSGSKSASKAKAAGLRVLSVAVAQDASGKALENALSYALALGCLKAGVIETTFKEETESDLFGEQAVLCGGVSELIRAGFETLTEAGYAPEIAYFECLHELKLIVDLIYEGGLGYMRYSISDTAEYGDYTRGRRIITDQTRAEMKKILSEIQQGEFARKWLEENRTGRKNFLKMREEAKDQPIEKV